MQARQRGDQIEMFFAAVHESAFGTKRTCRDEERMSAFEGKADITRGQRHVCFDSGAEVAPATLL